MPIGVGRVLWAEVRTRAKSIVSIHRFRTQDKTDRFIERMMMLVRGSGCLDENSKMMKHAPAPVHPTAVAAPVAPIKTVASPFCQQSQLVN